MSKWELHSIEIRKAWSPDPNALPYKGTIKFQSNEGESFAANIPPDRVQLYLSLIADEVVRNASELGRRIAESLGPEAQPNEQETK